MLKYTKDQHIEIKWELLCYTTYNQMYDFVRILASMQILVAAILRGSNLNIEIHDLLHSTLANEIRDMNAHFKFPKKDELKPEKKEEKPEVEDLTAGLADAHDVGTHELYKSMGHSSMLLNETRLNGQLLHADNVKYVDETLRPQKTNSPGVFVNGKRLKSSADYEYIEKEVKNVDQVDQILKNLKSNKWTMKFQIMKIFYESFGFDLFSLICRLCAQSSF